VSLRVLRGQFFFLSVLSVSPWRIRLQNENLHKRGNMRRLSIIAVLVGLSFAPPVARAWNDTGHMTVALIAYRQLDDAQHQKIAAILKAHPHYALFLSAKKPDGVSEDEWAFLRASTWPDFVRPSRPGMGFEGELFKGPEITHFHQPFWHYITVPWVPPMERKNLNPTTLPSRSEPNIATAFADSIKQLAAPDTKLEDKAVALAWVEHLIGDVHQPLHASTMFSSLYPQGDKGGNSVVVRSDGGVVKLHSFWDESLGTSDSYIAIDFIAHEITADPQLAAGNLPEFTKDTTFDQWIDESSAYGAAMVYLNGRLRTASAAAWDNKEITADQVPATPPAYAINAHDLCKRRAALAGYRLAQQLRTLLGQ
jgi:hypothetical protein